MAEVRIDLRFQAELSTSAAHGADAGPARYSLTRSDEGRWSARIQIDQHLEPRDVEFVLGHELDEIAELIRRYPDGVPPGGLEREMTAAVMRDGATSARATAHDVANAREIVALHGDHQKLLAARSPHATPRKEMLDRALHSAGLGEASQIDAKVRLLQEAGASEELLDQARRVESRRWMQIHSASTNSEQSYISEKLIDHVLWARERPLTEFISNGVDGGHHTRRLLDLGWPQGNYAFVEVASKPAAGSVARRFDQYRWSGEGAMPAPGSGKFPTDKGFDPSGWSKSRMPKTTFDDPEALLREADEAFQKWLEARGSKTGSENRKFRSRTRNGVDIGGFVEETPDGLTPTTVFVEASWF